MYVVEQTRLEVGQLLGKPFVVVLHAFQGIEHIGALKVVLIKHPGQFLGAFVTSPLIMGVSKFKLGIEVVELLYEVVDSLFDTFKVLLCSDYSLGPLSFQSIALRFVVLVNLVQLLFA